MPSDALKNLEKTISSNRDGYYGNEREIIERGFHHVVQLVGVVPDHPATLSSKQEWRFIQQLIISGSCVKKFLHILAYLT
jgi:hypothetical protein